MKVHELIEALKDMPAEAEVLHLWDGDARTKIEHVWLSRGGQVITADNNMVCYWTEVRLIDALIKEESRYWKTPGTEE